MASQLIRSEVLAFSLAITGILVETDPSSRRKVLKREKINITGVCITAEQPDRTPSAFSRLEEFSVQKKLVAQGCLSRQSKDDGEQNGYVSPYDEKLKRRQLFLLLCAADLFPTLPSFGKTKRYEVKADASENYVKRDFGLTYPEFEFGSDDSPKAV
ncbi:hypothetical protein RJ639_024164 [Escallonia herrerae]|uniref:Uncharacterized protein n=1 Tax=Escallonia herrerae TaxID=1293975 RepID=A0AA88UZ79_9ASTE|nr:hypothetical protein RJ639_024164 [Escallonia herrerae]